MITLRDVEALSDLAARICSRASQLPSFAGSNRAGATIRAQL
jgi:hypothetical protein